MALDLNRFESSRDAANETRLSIAAGEPEAVLLEPRRLAWRARDDKAVLVP